MRIKALKWIIFLVLFSFYAFFSFSNLDQNSRNPAASAKPDVNASKNALAVQNPGIQMDRDFGRMPLYFIANQGQIDHRVAYYVNGKDKAIYFTSKGVMFILVSADAFELENGRGEPLRSRHDESLNPDSGQLSYSKLGPANPVSMRESSAEGNKARRCWALQLDFVGANPDVSPIGQDKTSAIISYFKGKPDEWRTGLSTYYRIIYPDLWPGIDLVYSGRVNRLKYEFVVRPGADPSMIKLAYRGASNVAVDKEGRLEITTPLGSLHDDVPMAYQEGGGKRVDISMSYALEEAAKGDSRNGSLNKSSKPQSFAFGFRVGEYDRTRPIALDPAIFTYCGFIGGSSGDCDPLPILWTV